MTILKNKLKEVAGLLATYSYPCVFTGAGMSQESGLATYRDNQSGLWMNHNVQEVATALALHQNPQKVWDFFIMYRQQVDSVEPHKGHQALAHIEAVHVTGLPIITQNIDNLHERAGSSTVFHLHGQVHQSRCSKYCQGIPSLVDNDKVIENQMIPICPYCGAFLRPDVILFGEYLHGYVFEQAQRIARKTDLMLIIGTSALVAPASEIPISAQNAGATLIEINPEPSQLTDKVDLYIPLPAGEALEYITNVLNDSYFPPS